MPNKVLTIGAAVGVAALVLLLAVIAGGPSSGTHGPTPTVPENPDVFLGDPSGKDQLPIGVSEGFYYESHEGGRLMRITGDTLIPLPDGVGKLTPMDVKIELAPGRELTMTADQAVVVAPDNHPREGEMSGNVVVTFYETPDGSPVDFNSERDIVMRIYFDEPVLFDLELQQIDSDGPLFMTGPQIQFLGKGLSLNYNQLRHRIERLVIEQGQSLHYIPKPATKPDTATPPATDHSTQPAVTAAATQPAATAAATQPDTTTTSDTTAVAVNDDTDPEPDTSRPAQFYLATFEQLQDVRVGQDQYVIQGDDLSAVFSANAAGGVDNSEAPDSSDAPHAPATPDPTSSPGAPAESTHQRPTISNRSIQLASSDPLRGALLQAIASSFAQVNANAQDPRSLATFTDEDVIITWSGRLVITPLNDIPDEIASPDDVMVVVKGSPATILTDRGETILAPKRVSFLSQNARLLVEGTDAKPFTVDAPGMGTLIGRELSIDQLLGTGYVLGPGKLVGLIKDKPNEANSPSSPNPQPPTPNPKHITVAFHDRLDLDFYLKDKAHDAKPDTRSPAGSSRIKSIKTATFTGNIVIDYTQLDLTSDRLTLQLPPEQDAPATTDVEQGKDQLAINSLDAQGNVNVFVKDQDVTLQADHLHADPAKDQLELFGTQDKPAKVIRPDATLVGDHIVMDQLAGTVNVVGPGWFDYLQDPNDPTKTVRVTWVTSMQYDDAKGTAHFLGKVKTLSTDGTDTHELMGDDLEMTFVKDEDPSDDAQANTADNPGTPGTAGRRLATATMTGHVRFRARSYQTPSRKQMLTELFMMGPLMTFNDPGPPPPEAGAKNNDSPGSPDAIQEIQVIGTGRMLITDTRPEDTATLKPGKKNPGADSIDMAGRGKTAFEWSDRLTLDLTHGLMVMKGAVAMVHQPVDGDRVQLDCQDLAAELKAPTTKKSRWGKAPRPSGGGLLSKDAPKPELQRVWADGGIRILQGPYTIHCDHLLYQEAKRDILLWSDDPRQVTYEVQGEPNLTKSSALKWHRDTGRIEVFKIRTGTIPLRRDK